MGGIDEGSDFFSVTEIGGEHVSAEQMQRVYNRYGWAESYCPGRDVAELACGTGIGLGYLSAASRCFVAGDYSDPILGLVKRHYQQRIPLVRLDAQHLPFLPRSLDVILLFEAIYYLRDAGRFMAECARVLRPGGKLLIVTANKDLFDFCPSPFSCGYYGVVEMEALAAAAGFELVVYGDSPVEEASPRQRLLRPLKKVVVSWGLMPKTMKGKKFFKRLVFGKLVRMPAEIVGSPTARIPTSPLPKGIPDRAHKVLFFEATLRRAGQAENCTDSL